MPIVVLKLHVMMHFDIIEHADTLFKES